MAVWCGGTQNDDNSKIYFVANLIISYFSRGPDAAFCPTIKSGQFDALRCYACIHAVAAVDDFEMVLIFWEKQTAKITDCVICIQHSKFGIPTLNHFTTPARTIACDRNYINRNSVGCHKHPNMSVHAHETMRARKCLTFH